MSENDYPKQSEYTGTFEDIKGKKYLRAHSAIDWFHQDFPIPAGSIRTRLLSEKPILWQADIYVGEVIVGTAHAAETNVNKDFGKLETNAVRRALAYCGYGTEAAVGDDDTDAETGQSIPRNNANREASGKTGAQISSFANIVQPRDPVAWEATKQHFKAVQHFNHLYDQLVASNVLTSTMSDQQVIDAIHANREASGKANKGWFTDMAEIRSLKTDLKATYKIASVEAALTLLGKKLGDFGSRTEVVAAVREHVEARDGNKFKALKELGG